MARGITEGDVWTACDALLLSGARPTIERVRQHLGRGSPNTVGPHLDSWFKGLGARIQDPTVLDTTGGVPDPVQAVAKHLWEAAQAEARREIKARVAEGVAEARALAQACEDRARQAEDGMNASASSARRLEDEVTRLRHSLDEANRDRAAQGGRLEEVRAALAASAERVGHLEAQLVTLGANTAKQVAAAVERADAADRRVALELDRERSARAKAERAVDAMSSRMEAFRTDATAAAEALQRRLDATLAREVELKTQLAAATTELRRERDLRQDARRAAEVHEANARAARGQSNDLKQALERLTVLLEAGASRARKASPRTRRPTPAASVK